MTSASERTLALLAALHLAAVGGCALSRPPDPPPFDCADFDRADERFPDRCGDDAGVEENEDDDAGVGEDQDEP